MARKKADATQNGSISKMEAVRMILTVDPHVKPTAISERVKAEHGLEISPKMAGTYRYHILSKQRRKQRKVVRAVQAAHPSALDTSDGVDDLLRAARKLGWQRVQEIVEGVLKAPV